MMGFCVGVVGISLGDFEAMTMPECEAVCAAYNDDQDTCRRDAWERMRLLATIATQPHSKKKLTPHGFMPLP